MRLKNATLLSNLFMTKIRHSQELPKHAHGVLRHDHSHSATALYTLKACACRVKASRALYTSPYVGKELRQLARWCVTILFIQPGTPLLLTKERGSESS